MTIFEFINENVLNLVDFFISLKLGTILTIIGILSTFLTRDIFAYIILVIGIEVIWFKIWLKKYYTENFNKLVNVNDFYREDKILNEFTIETENFRRSMNKINEFILSSKNILFIHALGGQGKSHLLRKIAQGSLDGRKILFVDYSINKNYLNEIKSKRKYLLILDDADRRLPEAESLIYDFIKKNNIKLILSSRNSGFDDVFNIIKKLKLEGLYDEIELPKWSKDDLIELFRRMIGEERHDEEKIVNNYTNPFLVVMIAKKILNDPNFNPDDFEERFVNDIENDTQICTQELLEDKIEDFLINMALIVPFPENNTEIIDTLSTKLNLSEKEIASAIQKLKDKRILKANEGIIRFDPDLTGEAYLAYKLKKSDSEKKIKELMDSWASNKRIFRNLIEIVDIGPFDYNNYIRDALKVNINAWIRKVIEKAEITDDYTKIKILDDLKEVCQTLPEKSIQLINSYLNSPPLHSTDLEVIGWGLEKSAPTTDNYGPIILKLINNKHLRKEILNSILNLSYKKIKGMYSNYMPNYLIKTALSPLNNNLDQIIESFNIFLDWLEEPDTEKLNLIKEGLLETFSGVHTLEEFNHKEIKIHKFVQEDVPNIIQMRDGGLKIVEKMLNHSLLKVKCEGIIISGEMDRDRTIDEENLPLADRIREEREKIVELIGNLINHDNDFILLNEIENLFLRWWALEKEGTTEVRNYLMDISRPIEYIAFKFFLSGLVIENFTQFENDAPIKGRWKWFVNQKTEYLNRKYDPEYYKNFVKELDNQYESKREVLKLLKLLDDQISFYKMEHATPLIYSWVIINKNLFQSIRNNNALWIEVPERFKEDIDIALVEKDEKHLNIIANEVFNKLPYTPAIEIRKFLKAMGRFSSDPRTINLWLSKLLNEGNYEARVLTLSYLNFIFDQREDYDSIAKFTRFVISKESKLSDEIVNQLEIILFLLKKNRDSIKKHNLNDLNKEIIRKLNFVPDLRDTEEILDFVFTDIDTIISFLNCRFYIYEGFIHKEVDIQSFTFKKRLKIKLNKFFEQMVLMIKYRNCRTDEKNIKGYEPIPYNRIDFKDVFNSYKDFEKFFDYCLDKYNENALWELYLYDLMSHVSKTINKTSERLYIEEYIEKQIKIDKILNAIEAIQFLPFEMGKIPLIIKISHRSLKSKQQTLTKLEEVLLSMSTLENRIYSISPGEAPESLVKKREIFETLCNETNSPELISIFNKCLDQINAKIEWHMNR